MLLILAAAAALTVAQSASEPKSAYLDVVRRYAPGQEQAAVDALFALKINKASRVFEELDDRVCKAAGAQACDTPHLIAAGPSVRARIVAEWRRLYPRALALHVDALAASTPRMPEDINDDRVLPTDPSVQVSVLIHLAKRLEAIAAEPDVPPTFTTLATQARRMMLWALQFLGDAYTLAAALDALGPAVRGDVELRLARAMLEELRAAPERVRRAPTFDRGAFRRDVTIAREQQHRLEVAADTYEAIVTDHPALIEPRMRLAGLLLRLDRAGVALPHLTRAAGLSPDARQAYLLALLLADAYERLDRRADALKAYEIARQRAPGAQTPAIAMARLHALEGHGDEARRALATLDDGAGGNDAVRVDPWLGYQGGQAWRLGPAVLALQADFEAIR
jgi:tetratricopeptide (TPR) repeat protein